MKKREYASEHPWEYRAWRMNHRARKLQPSCVGEVTGAELEAIWGTGVCAYCARAAGTFDHVVPLQRGGDNTAANLLACCKSCNATKKDLMPAEWEKKRQVHHAAPTASQTA